ncbi:cobalamin-binding protein [Lutibacter sp. HS1-25]|uniref:cobalamin B12-binding domain-containing protein n=1 Tax=Lutibacter sp. HS1-25 TaxID=2485000 RepID=UPI0010110556|nr:cobalamin-dependent protein [Lutibacter sp. HS1-25]RXP57095.1 cobalamin-binding protein [Lutibacter sp. HS1-25]
MLQITNKIQVDFFNQLLIGNKKQCSEIVNTLLCNNVPIKLIYEDLFKVSLYKIGELWEYNKISVATEHLSAAIIESILNENYLQIISEEKINKNVLLCCVQNEFHQIGVKMISDIFEINGWTSFFLGSNVPAKDVILFSKTISVDVIAISISIYAHLPELIALIEKFRLNFPKTTILVGGQAFIHGGKEKLLKYHNVIFLPDILSTELFIKKMNAYE